MANPLTRPTRRAVLGAALALATPGVLRASAATEVLRGRAFGTEWSVTLPSGRGGEAYRPVLEALLSEVDRQMSPWRADSVVSGFNRGKAPALELPPEMANVTAAALDLARDSKGHFDPSVGPLVARWGFGPITEGAAPDWRGLALDNGHLTRAHPGLTLDLCGIAKGYALDLMAEALLASEPDLLIDLGGELRGHGLHPSGRAWQVAVQDPRLGASGLQGVMGLEGAVATSGVAVQSYALDGRRYGHIIDPATGEPVSGGLLSVSVWSGTAMQADGWATALFAAGTDGPVLARRAGLDALFLSADGAGLRHEATGAFARALL